MGFMFVKKLISSVFDNPVNRVHAMHSLRGLAGSVVAFFIPIYLLEQGFSLSLVLLFYVLLHVSGLVITFLVPKISSKIGLFGVLRMYVAFIVLQLAGLFLIGNGFEYVWPFVAVIAGISNVFYWIPYHLLFVRFAQDEDISLETAKTFAVPGLVKVFIPLGAAVLYMQFGFWMLLVIALVLYLLSLIPIVGIATKYVPHSVFSFKNAKTTFKKFKSYFASEIIDNVEQEANWLYPTFIYLNLLTVLSVGIAGTLTGVVGIVFALFVGWYLDKTKYKQVAAVRWGAFAKIGLWIGRFFAVSPVGLYVAHAGRTIVNPLFEVSYNAGLYKEAKKDDIHFIIFREVPVVIGRLIMFGLALVFVNDLRWLFLITAILFGWFLFYKKST